jgi:hypothetical protein
VAVVLGVPVALAVIPAQMAAAAAQTVTNCNDSGSGSLRQAVIDAASGDTVDFALSPVCSTITLTSGEIEITKNLTISGPVANALAVSGGDTSRIFEIPVAVTVSISGLTIEDGLAPQGTGVCVCLDASGGGISNSGTLLLTEAAVSGNATVSAPSDTGTGPWGGPLERAGVFTTRAR